MCKKFEIDHKIQKMAEQTEPRTNLNKFGQMCTSLDKFGQVWTNLNKFGQIWTSLDLNKF